MARSVCYHLTSTATAGGAGLVNAQILRAGRAYGVRLGTSALGGAGVGYFYLGAELNNSGTVSASSNNPPRETLLASLQNATPNAGVSNAAIHVPIDVPVKPGDVVYMSLSITGTAPSTALHQVDLMVMESS